MVGPYCAGLNLLQESVDSTRPSSCRERADRVTYIFVLDWCPVLLLLSSSRPKPLLNVCRRAPGVAIALQQDSIKRTSTISLHLHRFELWVLHKIIFAQAKQHGSPSSPFLCATRTYYDVCFLLIDVHQTSWHMYVIVAPVAGGPLEKKKESKLGITAKKGQGGVEFADWYTQVCTVSEMISYYDVSGRVFYFIYLSHSLWKPY